MMNIYPGVHRSSFIVHRFENGCGGRIRTFDSRINSAVPYQLGYATNIESGCGDETRTRIISFTRRALSYPIELRRNLVDWEGFKPSQEVCRTSMLSLHHQPEKHCQFPIVDCRLNISVFTVNRQLQIGNELVAEAGVEPAPFRL